ncbi:MAG: hypothetical protein ACOC16_02555 [Nanoarchaeota archaeon]
MILKNFKNRYLLLLFTCMIFSNIIFINAQCKSHPDNIEFYSSDYNYQINYSDFTTQRTYLKKNLQDYPLTVALNFIDIEDDCFSSNNDVQFRLFPSGAYISAESITKQSNITTALFNYNLNAELPDSFSGSYSIKTKLTSSETNGLISLGSDSQSPILEQLIYQPNTQYIASNTTIQIDYIITDTDSGLKTFEIQEVADSQIDLNGTDSYSGSYNAQLQNSQTYTLFIEDILGHSTTRQVNYTVDNTPPQLNNFQVKEYSRDTQANRFVSFMIEVRDDSFELNNPQLSVSGDFQSLNSNLTSVDATCTKSTSNNDLFICSWDNLEITQINESTNLDFIINAEDGYSNINQQTFNTQIFYDNNAPQIEDFYLKNSKGIRNIFNAYDENVTIHLSFMEESINDDMRIRADFDGLEYFINSECNTSQTNIVECIWDLGSSISKYSDKENGSLTFSVEVIDAYGNLATRDIDIEYDNLPPKINKIELIETNNIKDGIVSTNEEINFKLFIEDKNLDVNNEDLIYADFSAVDFRENMDKKTANCNLYNSTTTQCDFKSIVVDNGYMNRTLNFFVFDSAANMVIGEYNIEVFKVANESPRSFKIDDITITNILNRNVLSQVDQNAWFEGKLEKLNLNNDDISDIDFNEIKLINYQLLNCNDSDMNPILLGKRGLYPDEIVRGSNNNQAPYDFNLKFSVNAHPNLVDMQNEKTMRCKMSILKRDNQTLYPPEIVEFKLKYQFYGLPHDNLLQAHASKLLDEIDDIIFLEGYFDTIYSIYSIFNKICSVITSANSIISTITNIWVPISQALYATGYGSAPANYGDNIIIPGSGMISDLLFNNPIVKGVCDFVTCRNGGLLGSFWSGTQIGELAKKVTLVDAMDSMTSGLCQVSSAPTQKVSTDDANPPAGQEETPRKKTNN